MAAAQRYLRLVAAAHSIEMLSTPHSTEADR